MTHDVGERLLARARQGDREAFDALQAGLDGRVRGFVRRLIGNDYQLDDVVQDVFLALYINLERLEPIEKLYPFLFRVARNRCYDILRRQGRYQAVSLETYSDVISAEHSTLPDERTHWLLLYAEVMQAIDWLPELQRQTLILYAMEKLSYAEIAEAMGTKIGTVKSRLHHAKKTLRRLVRAETLEALGIKR